VIIGLTYLKSRLFLTGVAKRYDRHTIFETSVADATPATPLLAPLGLAQAEKTNAGNIEESRFLQHSIQSK